MKPVKLSLIVALTAGLWTGASAADSLEDAFKNGKASGAIQIYHWDRDRGIPAEITNFGLDLSYETARFHGFGLKGTFQSSSSPFADEDAKEAFKGDMYGSGARVSEAYLSYAMGKTTAKVGRMYFATPLIYGSGSRINRESYEGALITNSDLPDTKLTFGYVQKMQNRTDGNGGIGEFTKKFTWQGTLEDGAYTFVLNNSSIPNTKLTFAYLDAKDLMKISFTQAEFKKNNLGFAAEYYYSDRESQTDASDLFGLKATAQFNKLGVMAAYTTTGDQYVYAGLGNGADYAYTTSVNLSDVYTADTDAYKIGLSYAVNDKLKIGTNYVLKDMDAKNEKYDYTSFTANYKVAKNLKFALAYEKEGKDGNRRELRTKLVYSF